jgi:hypothetical protein
MDISVALLMDQRSVEDCPGSMVDGSAAKLVITGAAGGGGVVTTGAGGGGVDAAGGTFLAQPAANSTSATNSTAPNLEACNLKLSLILKSPLDGSLLYYCVDLLQTGFSLVPCVVSG